jgi:hypothetical protein
MGTLSPGSVYITLEPWYDVVIREKEIEGKLKNMSRNSAALLPTGTKMNPMDPKDATYYDEGQVAYVVESEDGKFKVLTSFGSLGSDWAVGRCHEIHHDQTFRNFGFFTVTGIRNYKTSEVTGEVPSKKLPHWVFK